MQKKFANVAAIYENEEELKKEDVDALKEWIKSQAHLPEIQELQLLLFFHSCYYNIDSTKKCIENYYTMRSKIDMFFTDRNVLSEDLQFQFQVSLITPLPSTTPENYMVFYVRLIDTIPANYIYSTQVKILDMVIQLALLQKGPKPGIVAIFDMEGTSFGHLFRISPFTSKKFVDYVQEALPVRLKAVHLINVNMFTAQFVTLLKPFMKRQLTQLIHVHRSVSSLYDLIPKEILPKESGGEAGTIKELHDAQITNLENHVDFFLDDEKSKADESKRVAQTNAGFAFKGLFN